MHSTKGVASGPISFMKVFDAATEEIKQGGTRRGANMGILRIDHPDIKDFIKAKDDQKVLRNFNISVTLTEEFMKAVTDDKTFQTKSPRSRTPVETLRAREIFDMVVEQAWKNGEPGIIFIDRINRDNPTPTISEIESTNPCGEQPLLPYESCNLGSINLAKMVKDNGVDWEKLKHTVHLCVHFLDNIIDANRYPIPQINAMTKSNRKVGLGVMGFADMLIQMKIPYDSEQALQLGEKIMSFIQDEGRKASADLAKDRGPFPNFEVSTYKSQRVRAHAQRHHHHHRPDRDHLHHLRLLKRHRADLRHRLHPQCHGPGRAGRGQPAIRKAHSQGPRVLFQGIDDEDRESRATSKGFPKCPDDVKKVFRTAHEIPPGMAYPYAGRFPEIHRQRGQQDREFRAGRQKGGHRQGLSAGLRAWLQRRNGLSLRLAFGAGPEHRRGQPSRRRSKKRRKGKWRPRSTGWSRRPRPEVISGVTRKMPTGCGTLYVTVNLDEHGHLFEVFTNMGKAGGCAASQAEGISRLISLALRAGIKSEEIVKQLKGIRCPMMAWWKGDKILSCADAIAKAIEQLPDYSANGVKNSRGQGANVGQDRRRENRNQGEHRGRRRNFR